MRTRSIVIAVSIIMAMVMLFTGMMVLVRVASVSIAEGARLEKMEVGLPEEGIILRYSEGVYIDSYSITSDVEFDPASEDNIQITVYADGRVTALFTPYDKEYGAYGELLKEETRISSGELQKLKDMIQESGIRFVADLDYISSIGDGDAAVTVIHDGRAVSVRREVCADESYSYDEEREKTLKLINYAADIMGEDKTDAFRERAEEWKKTGRKKDAENGGLRILWT